MKPDLFEHADYIKEQLEKGLLDIGVLIEPTELSKYEYVRLPVKDCWGALLPSMCPLTQKDCVKPEDLKDTKVFLSARAKQTVTSWFGEYFNEDNVLLYYNLLYNAAMLVKKGLGAAFTLDGAAMPYFNSDVAFRPLEPKIEVTSVLVWKKYQVISPTVKALIDYVRYAIQ